MGPHFRRERGGEKRAQTPLQLSHCAGHAEGNRERGSVPPPILWVSDEEEYAYLLAFRMRFMAEGVETSLLRAKGRQAVFCQERECWLVFSR